jgi:hypothetical protein
MNVRLGGQEFQTDGELKRSVLNWLRSKDKTFYAAGISNLPDNGKNVSVYTIARIS